MKHLNICPKLETAVIGGTTGVVLTAHVTPTTTIPAIWELPALSEEKNQIKSYKLNHAGITVNNLLALSCTHI